MTMVRKQVYISREQDDALKRTARRLGVTEAEVVRRALEVIERDEDEATSARLEAWARIKATMEKHAATRPPGSGIDKWSREDAYDDERHARLLR